MSGIVLSASVRQNLLSLQSTAALLATTQNDLATGNTSLQSLISNAQSIANQVLQTTSGNTTKSTVTSTAIAGATANNLLGPGTSVSVTGAAINNDNTTAAAPITAATQLVGTPGAASNDLAAAITSGSVLTVDGKTITFSNAQATTTTDSGGNVTIGIGTGSTATVQTVLSAIDGITGTATASTVAAGKLVLNTGTTQNLVIAGGTGNALTALGLAAGTTDVTPPALDGQTLSIAATGGGTATNITFGTGTGQISSL